MSNSIVEDTTLQAAKLALDGLSLRQQAISKNIANIDTPGYRAETVNFEDTLKSTLQGSDKLPMTVTNAAHLASPTESVGFSVSQRPGGSTRADQNDVDINVELTDMMQTSIQYQAITQSVSQKLQLLKTIAESR